MSRISIIGVGDVLVDRAEPTEALEGMRPLFERSDLTVGNFEGVLTDHHAPTPGSARATVVPTANAEALGSFAALSLANNHSLDAGYEGLADTMAALSAQRIAVVGAGSSLAEALTSLVLERNGVSVGIVAVTSVFRVGAEARKGLPGIAPLRAHDYYGPRHPGDYDPGVPPRVVSILDEGDWGDVAAAIASVRERVDVLVVSIHWGDYSRPWILTEHERSCARRLIGADADVVFGHHHHFMRGMEFIEGRPVFYGLGHLAFDHPQFVAELRSKGVEIEDMSERELVARYGEFGIYPRRDSPDFPFHPLARRTGAAVVEAGKDGVLRCGIVPGVIDGGGVARPIRRGNAEWGPALAFLRDCVEKGGLETEVIDTGWVHGGYDVVEFCRSAE